MKIKNMKKYKKINYDQFKNRIINYYKKLIKY